MEEGQPGSPKGSNRTGKSGYRDTFMTELSGTGSSRVPKARDFSHERRLHEAKDAFDHGVIKTGDHSFILSLWQYKVPTDEPVAYYNYAATKLLGLLFIGMGFQTDEDLWQRQPLGQIIHFHDLGPGSDPECRAQAFARAFMMPCKQFLDFVKKSKNQKKHRLNGMFKIDRGCKYFHVPQICIEQRYGIDRIAEPKQRSPK